MAKQFTPDAALTALQQQAQQADAARANFFNIGVNGYGNYLSYATETNQLFNQIMNYGDFSYDKDKDSLFQMYKKQYIREGGTAMKDTLGKAAANNGGYGSSYAQTAAQKTYNNYMKDLSEKGVETYQNSRNQWQQDKDALVNRYSIASDMKSSESDAYYKQLNAYADDANIKKNAYDTAYGNQYGAWHDTLVYDQTTANNQANQKYQNQIYNLEKKKINGK